MQVRDLSVDVAVEELDDVPGLSLWELRFRDLGIKGLGFLWRTQWKRKWNMKWTLGLNRGLYRV